jgi:putative nucleotidyltransferase with HDIG domain
VAATIAAGAVLCIHSAWQLSHGPFSSSWAVLLALTAAAGWATLRVPSMPISFSISDTFTIVAALIVGPAAGALTAALDGLVLSFRMANDKRSAGRVLFNMASLALATWTAGQVFFLSGDAAPLQAGPLGALVLMLRLGAFGVVHFGLNSGLVAVAVAWQRGTAVSAIWREHFAGLWLSTLGGVFAALLMMVLSRPTPLETLILIAPLPVILYITLRHALGRAEDQIHHLGKMNRVYLATIEALAHAVDAKDHVTHDHVRRVQENALRLATALGVRDDADLQAIKAASLLHDIGKIAIPEHILNKPGKLTAPEFEIMKRHAAIGADILAVIGFPYPLVPIVRHHHENWDGTGYPDGLAGEAIPIGARILQVVDCYDALTSDRPYRPAMSARDALGIVHGRRGTMYDPRVVDAMVALHAAGGALAPAASRTSPAPSAPPAAAQQAAAAAPAAAPYVAFARLGAELALTFDLRQTVDAVGKHAAAALPAEAIVLFEYDRDSDALLPAATAGTTTFAPDTLVPLGTRVSGWVAATRRAFLNGDARLDLEGAPGTGALRSVLAVPVLSQSELVGVLAFYATRPDAFTEAQQAYAEALAEIVAPALRDAAPRLRAVAV